LDSTEGAGAYFNRVESDDGGVADDPVEREL